MITNYTFNDLTMTFAPRTGQQANTVAIGSYSGSINATQNGNAISIGSFSGYTGQGGNSISIGIQSGQTNQSAGSIAIGQLSGGLTQGGNSVAIGGYAGFISQGGNSVAIGSLAGNYSQGGNSIAIGTYAGQTSQPANSIVINASGSALSGATSSACYINPIRNAGTFSSNILAYDTTAKEVFTTNSMSASKVYITSAGTTVPSFAVGNPGSFNTPAVIDGWFSGVLSLGNKVYFYYNWSIWGANGGNFYFYYGGNAENASTGTAYIDTTGNYHAVSDRRRKTNITDLSYGLTEVLNLRPVSYNFVHFDETVETSTSIGLIAQEVEPIIPEVTKINEGVYSLNYTSLIPVLINAIKELEARVAFLEAKINNP